MESEMGTVGLYSWRMKVAAQGRELDGEKWSVDCGLCSTGSDKT